MGECLPRLTFLSLAICFNHEPLAGTITVSLGHQTAVD